MRQSSKCTFGSAIELVDRAVGRLAKRGVPGSERRVFTDRVSASRVGGRYIARLAPGLEIPQPVLMDQEGFAATARWHASRLPIGPDARFARADGLGDIEGWEVLTEPFRIQVRSTLIQDGVWTPVTLTFTIALDEPDAPDGEPTTIYELTSVRYKVTGAARRAQRRARRGPRP